MAEIEFSQPAESPAILGKYSYEINQALSEALSIKNISLLNMLRYHIGWVDVDGLPRASNQGKGLRSSLCLFSCEAVGGSINVALPLAAGIELIHNFSLIHDDIQDGDMERRHRPTVWANWGKPKALQAGNTMRVLADLALQKEVESIGNFNQIAACSLILTTACLDMIEGQYLDLYFEGRTDIDSIKYLKMVSRKTGALIRCSMELGAIVGNADHETVGSMALCGSYMGNVFQIRDDYLGIWGYEKNTGKSIGNDIRKKKNSLPIVFAMEKASVGDKRFIQEIYGKSYIKDDDVDHVMSILHKVGAKEYVQELAETEAALAYKALDEAKLIDGSREQINELIRFLLYREN